MIEWPLLEKKESNLIFIDIRTEIWMSDKGKPKPKRHVSRRYVRFACTYDGLWSSHVLGFGRATVAVVESEAVESNGGKRAWREWIKMGRFDLVLKKKNNTQRTRE